MSRLLASALAVAVTLAACSGDRAERRDGGERSETLRGIPLRPGEAPEGLEEDAEGTGPLSGLRDVLPPRRTAPGLPNVPEDLIRSFDAGYQRVFTDPSSGARSAASSALRFDQETGAERFFELFADVHEAMSPDGLLPAPELGDAAYGWTHVVPGAETTGYVWRSGGLILTVSLSGQVGEAGPEAVLPLARRVDGRLDEASTAA